MAEAPVALHAGQQMVGTAKTNANGHFQFTGLRSGLYQVTTPHGQQAFRCWNADSAPPAALPHATITTDTVRGQYGMKGFTYLMANPWFVAGSVTLGQPGPRNSPIIGNSP